MNNNVIDEKKDELDSSDKSTTKANNRENVLFSSALTTSEQLRPSTADFISEQETTFIEGSNLTKSLNLREEESVDSVMLSQRVKSEYEIERKRFQKKIVTLENDIKVLNLVLKEYSSKNADSKKEKDLNLSNENSELKRQIEFFKNENQKIKSEFLEKQKLHNYQQGLEVQLEELRKENSRLNVENHAQRLQIEYKSLEIKQKISNLEIENFDLNNLYLREQEKVMQLEKRMDLVLLEKEKSKEELNLLKNNLLLKEHEVLEKNKEIELLRNDVLKYMSQIDKVLLEKRDLYNTCKDYRERLCVYAKFLNRKKFEITTEFEFLLKEYQTAEISHPVQDYLDFTNLEILRLEKQLRATPTVSIDRVQLEQSLNKLTEQRELLETVINKRKADLEIRIAKLKDTIGRTLFDLVPPPPPKNFNLKTTQKP